MNSIDQKLSLIRRAAAGIRACLRHRFAFLRWPITGLPERIQATRADRLMNAKAAASKYPTRALRYWWTRCALLEELAAAGGEAVVADVGCSTGHIKRFVGDLNGVRWIGLDWKIEEQRLRECGYSEWHQCDFNARLPLGDASVDIVIFLHVVEHLPDPEFTLGELSRILRPGGLLLAGSPVAPGFAARLRDRELRARHNSGKTRAGGHINSMDCGRWKSLLNRSGLAPEIATGAFLLRWSGNPLENTRWWLRLNQLWGSLFPGWGGEIYLSARKARARPYSAPAAVPPLLPRRAWLAVGAAACCLLAALALVWHNYNAEVAPIRQMVAEHQDGNDVFFVLDPPGFPFLDFQTKAGVLREPSDLVREYKAQQRSGQDPYFLVLGNSLTTLQSQVQKLDLRVVGEVLIRGRRFVLLGSAPSP